MRILPLKKRAQGQKKHTECMQKKENVCRMHTKTCMQNVYIRKNACNLYTVERIVYNLQAKDVCKMQTSEKMHTECIQKMYAKCKH